LTFRGNANVGYVRYFAKKAVFLVATLIIALYLTVLIANMGGFLDRLLTQQTKYEVLQDLKRDPHFNRLSPEQQNATYNNSLNDALEARGLTQPFFPKSIRFTVDLITFRLGVSTGITSASGSQNVGDIIFERLPRTILLFTTASFVSAGIGIWLGLRMARKALSVIDRGLSVLSITTTVVPPWVFGIMFILIFGFAIPIFPSGGMVSIPAKTGTLDSALDVLYHMTLPLFAVVVSSFGSWAYTTRNLVLQIMDEDYVYAARARGLPEKRVLNRYVLRAASPPTVTSLALTIIASWQGAIITETVFNWPGLGRLFFDAIIRLDAPVVIGLTAIYAYLLVLTVLLLDLIYGLLDPRVRAVRV